MRFLRTVHKLKNGGVHKNETTVHMFEKTQSSLLIENSVESGVTGSSVGFLSFDDTSENYWKEKYLAEHREKEDYARKIGQLAMQVDWLKKKSEETLGPGYEDKFTPKPFKE